jgi:hypothetical protein
MIVGIVKIDSELKALEEFRNAIDESTAVSAFCNEYSPVLNTADYLGVNADSTDLQKNWGWDFSEATPALKEIVNIVNHPMPINLGESNDYSQFREYTRAILDAKTWVNLSNSEKDFMIDLYLKEAAISQVTDDTNKATHLITTGQATDAESVRLLIVDRWSKHHILDVESCRARANALKLYISIGTYLSISDATDFFMTVENLYVGFRDQAIKGTQDGSEEGLFDYIESTVGTVYEFAGLSSKGYAMQNGDLDELNFIAAIMDVIRHGKYISLDV